MDGASTDQRLGGLRKTGGGEHERMALPAAEPTVEADQPFEGGALVGHGVVEAVDEQVGAVVEAARAAEMIRGVRSEHRERVGALDAAVVEMMNAQDLPAASLLTVMRTSSDPACASWTTCLVVASMSAVSVLVMACTTMGASPPICTGPTGTPTVLCLDMRGTVMLPV